MVERLPPSNKIQKRTSRIGFIGLAAAATVMITASMIGAIQMQQASAAKPMFCYDTISRPDICSPTMKECRTNQAQDEEAGVAISSCHAEHA